MKLLLMRGPVAGKFPPRPANFSLMRGNNQSHIISGQVEVVGGMGQNLDVLLLYEGEDLGFVGLLSFWIFFSPGTVDDVIF